MDNSFIQNFYDDLFSLLRIVIPLSFTIYIFAYRERKEIAYSVLKKNYNFYNISYLVTSVVLFLAFLENRYINSFHKSGWYLAFVIIFTIIWLFLLIIIYSNILSSINLFKVTIKNYNKFEKKLNRLVKNLNKFKKSNHTEIGSIASYNVYYSENIKDNLNSMILNLEIIYQTLVSQSKFNLQIDFIESNKNYNKQVIRAINNLNNDYYELLILAAPDEYLRIYSLVLKNNILLLSTSVDKNSTTDINVIISSFKELLPNQFQFEAAPENNGRFSSKYPGYRDYLAEAVKFSDNFLIEYYKHVYEMMIILKSKNNLELLKILKLIYDQEKQSNLYIRLDDLTSLSLSTMFYAIEKNNIKFLTNLTNVLLNSVIPVEEFMESNDTKRYLNGFLLSGEFNEIPDTDGNESNLETVTLMAILLIIKSIELGHYQCAGFLIKVLCGNIDLSIINSILFYIREEIDNKGNISMAIFQDEEINLQLLNELSVEFHFSRLSINYCFEKALFLILGQLHFLASLNQIESENILFPRMLIFDNDMLGYIRDKVADLSKEYGLIFLKKSDFLMELVEGKSHELEDELSKVL